MGHHGRGSQEDVKIYFTSLDLVNQSVVGNGDFGFVAGEVGKIDFYFEAGLGIIAGLAWNEAVKALIEYFIPLSGNTVLAKFVYAVVITFVVVLISVYLTSILKRTE